MTNDQLQTALSELIPLIYSLFAGRGFHPAMAEELTQQTVFDGIKGLGSFDSSRGSFKQWLMGIANRNIALVMRKRTAQAKLNGKLSDYMQRLDTELLPDELLEKDETAALVRKAISELNDKEQAVLTARYLEDMSIDKIHRQMNVTTKAVHNLLYRARLSLRDKLKKENEIETENALPKGL